MNKKNLIPVILSQIIFANGAVHADDNLYSIQPGSHNNTIVIEVENKITETLQNLDVVFLDTPEWISIINSSVVPTVLLYDSTALITVVFNVEPIPDQSFDRRGNLSVVLTAGDRKLFSKTIGLTIAVPAEYQLHQNYPNPFNPSTQINYTLPKESLVSLRIYNALGQEIITLANGEQKAGYVTATWDGRNGLGNLVNTGLYFYRIEANPIDGGNAFIQVKKMMLLK